MNCLLLKAKDRLRHATAPALLLLAGPLTLAQLPSPDLRTIFPPGAQIGTSVEVTIGGAELEESTELVFTHPGIKCEQIPLATSEFMPASHEPTRYRISVAAEVPAGTYEVMARTRLGFTAPRGFAVGTLPEIPHVANNSLASAMPLPLNTVVNGHADNAAIDYYQLELKQGQRVLIRCHAEEIDSRMDATLALTDSGGHELMNDRDTVGRDALLNFKAPKDDTYLLRVYDFTFRGNAEFPYRLVASDAPHIDFIWPPAGKPDTTGRYTIYGRNLPGGSPGEGVRLGVHELESIQVEIPLTEQGDPAIVARSIHASLLPGMEFRLESKGKMSNPVRIGFATDPITPGEEGREQTVTVPTEIHACFDSKSDLDHYRFEAKKDVPLWIECIADRIRGTSDPILIVEKITRDKDGVEQLKEIASNDDAGSRSGGFQFPILSRDSYLRFAPPADGIYRVTALNQTGNGGAHLIYRLLIRPLAPDFDLVVTPWPSFQNAKAVSRNAAVLRQGGTALLRVFAMRRNGFKEAISLRVDGLPPGVTCGPATIKAGQDTATLILKSTEDAATWQGFASIKGSAGDLGRSARAATISWSIGNWDVEWTKPRLSQQLPVSVCGTEKAPIVIQPAQSRFEVALDGKLEIPFTLAKNCALKGDFIITPSGLPFSSGKAPTLKLKQDATGGTLALTFKKTKEFAISPGEWHFTLMGSGTVKHKNNLAAIERTTGDQKRIEELEKTFLEEAKQSKAAVDPARKALQDAENNLKAASGEAKPPLEARVKEKRSQLQEAEKKAADTEAKAKRATTEKNNAAARVKQATERAKEKDLKHTTHSQLITVVVNAPPPKEEGK